MSEETSNESVMEERKFLHDVSNHIVVAHGMATFALRAIKENPDLHAKEIERLEKALIAINKMTDLIHERRAILHARS